MSYLIYLSTFAIFCYTTSSSYFSLFCTDTASASARDSVQYLVWWPIMLTVVRTRTHRRPWCPVRYHRETQQVTDARHPVATMTCIPTRRHTTLHRRRSTAERRPWSFGTMRLAQAIVGTTTAIATVVINTYINITIVTATMATLLMSKRRCTDNGCYGDSFLIFVLFFIIIILFIHIFLTCFSILIFVFCSVWRTLLVLSLCCFYFDRISLKEKRILRLLIFVNCYTSSFGYYVYMFNFKHSYSKYHLWWWV